MSPYRFLYKIPHRNLDSHLYMCTGILLDIPHHNHDYIHKSSIHYNQFLHYPHGKKHG